MEQDNCWRSRGEQSSDLYRERRVKDFSVRQNDKRAKGKWQKRQNPGQPGQVESSLYAGLGKSQGGCNLREKFSKPAYRSGTHSISES